MPWINDVVPYTTILSTWGNNIRNHVVHQFLSKGDRDANGHPVEGMLCQTADDNILWHYVDGGWQVESMPYKAFTPRIWAGLSGPTTEIGVQGTVAGWWTQRRGLCHAQMRCTVDLVQFQAVNVWIYATLPTVAQVGGHIGSALVFQTSSGLMHGGAATWVDNQGSQSRIIVNNVGPGVPPNSTINVPGSSTKVDVYYNLEYLTAPNVDTAP